MILLSTSLLQYKEPIKTVKNLKKLQKIAIWQIIHEYDIINFAEIAILKMQYNQS